MNRIQNLVWQLVLAAEAQQLPPNRRVATATHALMFTPWRLDVWAPVFYQPVDAFHTMINEARTMRARSET